MGQYYTIVTTIGTNKIAQMVANGTKLQLTKIKVGDGNGAYYEPSIKQTTLKNVNYEADINSIKTTDQNPNWLTVEAIIPADIGGFYIREVGLFDVDNNLIAVGKYSETYKPLPSEGTAKELIIRMVIDVDNVNSVSLSVNGNLSVVTLDDLTPLQTDINQNKADIAELKTKTDSTESAVNNLQIIETAQGTANAITLTGVSFDNGFSKTFIVNNDNSGVTTTINGKPLYKPNTTSPPNLKKGKAVTVWYNLSGNCFFIKASATGNAPQNHVLAGDLYSNENDTDIVGTMPNNGAIGTNLAINGSYTIPAGYTSGGTVTQSIPTRGTSTITPGTSNQTIASGQYLSGIQTILGDPELNPSNIVNGVDIFGVVGNVNKVQYASGTTMSTVTNSANKIHILNLNGLLSFSPDFVFCYFLNGYYCRTLSQFNPSLLTPVCSYMTSNGMKQDTSIATSNPDTGRTYILNDVISKFGSYSVSNIPLSYGYNTSSSFSVQWIAYKVT